MAAVFQGRTQLLQVMGLFCGFAETVTQYAWSEKSNPPATARFDVEKIADDIAGFFQRLSFFFILDLVSPCDRLGTC
jgi:hypothetical protein